MYRIENRRIRVILSALVMFSLACSGANLLAADKDDDEYYELMKKFVDTFEQIERNYVKKVDRKELLEAAIRGMVSKLDQYSNYISQEDLSRFTQEVEQEFGGIGIQVQIDPATRRLLVMTPLPGTPAYKAGVRAGDLIMDVEGKSTEGITLMQAVRLLKGKPGEPVTIGVKHDDSEAIEKIEIVRALIKVATVLGDTYNPDNSWNFMADPENKIGFIRLTHFSRRSNKELRAAIEQLRSQGMKGLILDLRTNPGGLLSQAVAIADMFITSGKIVSTEGKNSPVRVMSAKKSGTYKDFPLVVLVNRYSASASEIVSACLQDHKRAVIVGERSWGKGSVQNVIQLEGGNSALKLTTASYHRPSGKNIHRFPGAKESDEWGVTPDDGYRVRFSRDEMREYLDYRRKRDVLKDEKPPETDYKDRQFAKAHEYLLEKLAKGDDKAAEKKEDKPKAAKPEKKKDTAADKKADKDAAAVAPVILIPRSLAG